MRVVFCWMGISGYMAACWRALAARGDLDVSVIVAHLADKSTAFDVSELTRGYNCDILFGDAGNDPEQVAARVVSARPDIVVLSGWAYRGFRGLPFDRRLSGARFIMAMDTPWRNTLRKQLAGLLLRRYLRRLDAVVVAGERSWQYARVLGIPEARIYRGVYGADTAPLAPLHARRLEQPGGWPKRFVFVGRYVPEKGIDVLMDAYGMYRVSVPDPWPLTCCGMGPLRDRVRATPGVEDAGFLQPARLPEMLLRHGVFVLSSRYEPWGVVIVEAAAAGLPVICSEACGSSVELVRAYYSGLTVPTGDPAALARAMAWCHAAYDRLPEMGARGSVFGAAYSAEMWAERWASMLARVCSGHGQTDGPGDGSA